MKLTKYEHACFVIEESGRKLIVDPGNLTQSFGNPANTVAVVITHQHGDHFFPEHLDQIISANPAVQVFMPADAAAAYQQPNVTAVTGGEQYTVGPFNLRFYGEQHAVHHASLPRVLNSGVLVNESVFYPGDAFTPCDIQPAILALPASAPWLKVGEAMDYLQLVSPDKCFMTHDAVLSEAGHRIHANILQKTAEAAGVEFMNLRPGDTIDC